jgi:hypothetical protein
MTPALRTLAFGDLDGAAWGAGWFPGGSEQGLAGLGAGSQEPVAVALQLADSDADADAGADGADWRLEGERVSLLVSPVGEAVAAQAIDEQVEGFEQLCRVAGRFELDGSEHTVECLGVRSWWSPEADLNRFESVRAVSTWFEPDEALTLTAFRGRKAKAHDGDIVAGAVINPQGSPPVEDPRLSTTYEGDGWPIRAGLELWLAAPNDSEQQFPRRASGEATGPRVHTAGDGGLELRAEPFRWHSRGRDGAGMYILARRR